jgi:two-component system copper resistance phosphate regulon response regulator CusR
MAPAVAFEWVMRILVVEDEGKTARYLQRGLVENGYEVDVAAQGDKGLRLALAQNYDLIVLDVMLPGQDGWSVLAALRAGGRTTPILFLTACDTIEDRVKGLDGGADDYLVKPFAFSELLARIRLVLRRAPVSQAGGRLRVADLELDLIERKAVRGGQRLDLTAKEFALLALLARRKGEIFNRGMLARLVWEMNFVSETNVVEVAVRRLRTKVDDPFARKLIRTVRGVGYTIDEA